MGKVRIFNSGPNDILIYARNAKGRITGDPVSVPPRKMTSIDSDLAVKLAEQNPNIEVLDKTDERKKSKE